MLIALFTDIHGNREALEACLAHAGRRPIDRFVFLGDYVGYGADPGFVVELQPQRVLMMPDGTFDYWSDELIDLVAMA